MTIKQHGGIFGRNPAFNEVSVETLSIAGTALSSTAAELNILDGVTADATEINYLDGASTSVVTASKAVLANASANIAFASGKGIDFSATGDAGGMTSELFDDYEEGTYTVTLTPTTSGSVTVFGDRNEASYIKIGSMVFVQAQLFVVGVSSPVGDLNLSLPFTSADITERAERAIGIVHVEGSASKNVQDFGLNLSGGQSSALLRLTDSTSYTSGDANQMQANTEIYFSMAYRAA